MCQCRILHAGVYPELPHLFQQALNVEHHVAEGETWDQQLLNIARLAEGNAKRGAQGTVVDWDKVSRLVRQTAPPFIRDVPGHIGFLKKYGGGAQQTLAKELIAYLNLRMPAGRKVSGHFIDQVGKIPMTPDFSIPHFANAVIKTCATCDESECMDGFAKFIVQSNVQQLSKKYKAKAFEAEGILVRAKEVIRNVERDCAVEVGDFECNVVKSVLEKIKTPLLEIAEAFLRDMTGTSTGTDTSTSTSTGTTSSGSVIGNTIELSAGVSADVGKMTILHNGFNVGMTVEESGKSAPGRAHLEGNLYKISFIASDGSVTLMNLDKNGAVQHHQVTSKSMNEFLSVFKVFKQDIEVDERQQYHTTSDFKCEVFKGVLLCALDIASQKSSFQCQAQKKPVKALVAIADMKVGDGCIMVPTTSSFKVLSETDTAEFVATVTLQGTQHRFQLQAPPPKQGVSNAFVMRSLEDKSLSNCAIEHMQVSIPLKYKDTGAATKYICDLPVIKLTKDVKALDELVLPHTKVATKKIRQHVFAEARPAKAAKVE